jgi:hypothetical protein
VAGLGAIADLGFVGLDDSDPDADPAVITGYKAARNRPVPLQSHRRALDLQVDLMRRYGQDRFSCLSVSYI